MQEPLGRLRRDLDLFFVLTCAFLFSIDFVWLHLVVLLHVESLQVPGLL